MMGHDSGAESARQGIAFDPAIGRLERRLDWAVGAIGLAAAAAFLIAAAARLAYPYELEWLESEMLQHVLRRLAGLPLHTAPSADFSPTIYPPLYADLSALLARIIGPGLLAPRMVSVASTVCAALLAALVASRIGGDRRGGLVAAALVFAAYVGCGTVFDLARLDPLWVLLLLAGTAIAAGLPRPGGSLVLSPGRAACAGLVLALANATKQPAGLFPLVLAAGLARHSRRSALALFAAWVTLTAIFYGYWHWTTGGWSTTYLIWIPLRVQHLPGELVHYLRDDILRTYAPSVILLALWALRSRADSPPLPTAWWLGLAAAIAATTSMRTLEGGGANTLMPLCLFGAVLVGAVSGRVLQAAAPAPRIALRVALAVQFGMLVYHPRSLVPTAAAAHEASAFVDSLRSYHGEVWVPSHTSYAYFAGQPFQVHRDPLLDLLYSGWEAFPNDLLEDLERGRFAAVMLDGPFAEERLQAALEQGYALTGPVTPAPPLPLVGYRTRPVTLYLPRRTDPAVAR